MFEQRQKIFPLFRPFFPICTLNWLILICYKLLKCSLAWTFRPRENLFVLVFIEYSVTRIENYKHKMEASLYE